MFHSKPLDTRFVQSGVSRPQTTARHQNRPKRLRWCGWKPRHTNLVHLGVSEHGSSRCHAFGGFGAFGEQRLAAGLLRQATNMRSLHMLVWLPKCTWLSECICCLTLWRSCGFRSNITMVSTSIQVRFLASWWRYCENCPFPRLSNNSLKLEDLAFKRRKIGELQHPLLEVEGFLTLLFTRSFSLYIPHAPLLAPLKESC